MSDQNSDLNSDLLSKAVVPYRETQEIVKNFNRSRHAMGERNAGINVRKGLISNILEEDVVQPLLVSTSAVELATETVCLLLKIDDYVQAR